MFEPVVIVLVVAAVLLTVGLSFVAVRRRGRDAELDAGASVLERGEGGLDLGRGATETLERVDVEPDSVDQPAIEVLEPPVADEPQPSAPAVIERPSFFERLGKARSAFTGYLGDLVGLSRVDAEAWEELEEALIRADIGVSTSMSLIEDVQQRAKDNKVEDGKQVLGLLKERMHEELADKDRSLRLDEGKTNVWLIVGVNGVGKTTTIGKLGKRLVDDGHKPLMAAGDTFRAAAAEQLTTWAERSGSEIVRGSEGGDPSSVIFDGVAAAAARGCDVVLADTAGRLHNKSNLMDELSKVRRVAAKDPGHVTEVLLVLDATTGQNGMSQAKVFTEAVDVTGVVLTKLDGSAKGGIVFAIESELGLPVKLVGLGEGVDDLVDFEPTEFVDALFE